MALNRGGFWLARRVGLPVFPIVIAGTRRVWEHPYSPTRRHGRPVALHVLAPIPGHEAWRRAAEVEDTMRTVALADEHALPRRSVPEEDGDWDGYPYEIAPTLPELLARVAAHRRAAARGVPVG